MTLKCPLPLGRRGLFSGKASRAPACPVPGVPAPLCIVLIPQAPHSLKAVGCAEASAACWCPRELDSWDSRVSPGLGLVFLQRPQHLHTKPSQAPAVEVTPAGASYNPTFEDHQVHGPPRHASPWSALGQWVSMSSQGSQFCRADRPVPGL